MLVCDSVITMTKEIKLIAGVIAVFVAWLFVLYFVYQTNEFVVIKAAKAEESYWVEMFEITQYNPVAAQTDSDPDIAANGRKVNEMTAACPSRLEFETLIEVAGKQWRCEDRMARRYRTGNFIDLLVFDEEAARQFGRQQLEVKIYR